MQHGEHGGCNTGRVETEVTFSILFPSPMLSLCKVSGFIEEGIKRHVVFGCYWKFINPLTLKNKWQKVVKLPNRDTSQPLTIIKNK